MDTPIVAEVVEAIEAAFDGVSRGNGITLHQADAIDDHLSDEEQNKARQHDTETRWQEIPDELIEHFSGALCFVDGEGFRYYIAAFMRWVVTHYEESDSFTVDSTIYKLGDVLKFPDSGVGQALPIMTDAQLSAICKFLLHMRTVTDHADASHAQLALDAFWGRYAS